MNTFSEPQSSYATLKVDWAAIKQRNREDGAWSGVSTSPTPDKVIFDERTVEVEIEKAKVWLLETRYSPHTMYVV